MEEKQLDVFWEIKCPKCGQPIDIEVLLNSFSSTTQKLKIKR
jgi:hypothetical protein